MNHSQIKKSLILLTACLASSCAQPVNCHRWTDSEIAQLKQEDEALAPDATMHALIKNYEAICG